MGFDKPSTYGGFGEGIVIRGMPILTLFTGKVIWVDSNTGSSSTKGTFRAPVKTILAAHALVTTNKGDIIAVKPGHAEAPTATVTFTKSGFAIIGQGYGDLRPTITPASATATSDVWDFEGSDIVVYNMKIAGATAGTTITSINLSGDDVTFDNCYFELNGKTLILMTLDTAGQIGVCFTNNTVLGSAAGADSLITVETYCDQLTVENNRIFVGKAAGFDEDMITFVSEGSDHIIKGNIVTGMADGKGILVTTSIQNDSLCADNYVVSDDASDAFMNTKAGSFGFIWNWSTDQGSGQPSGLISSAGGLPGIRPINTTAAE